MNELTWTDAAPTEPGWYWWRKRAGKVPVVVELERMDDGRLRRTDVDVFVPGGGTYGQLAGPIPEPEETQPPG